MSVGRSRCFLDTNILVYAWSDKDISKHEQARLILSERIKLNSAVISTQVLQEFFNVVTTKMGCDKLVAKEAMMRFSRIPHVEVNLALIQEAIDISILSQLSFWDSLVIASAEHANCRVLYTEDLNDGQTIRGVRITNPFI